MTRKFGQILFLSLLTFAFLAGSAFAEDVKELKKDATLDQVLQTIDEHPNFPHDSFREMPANKNMGADDAGPGEINAYFGDAPRSLGFDQRGTVTPGPAVGMTVGLTTYDYQHNGRCTRQVSWRGSQDVHVAWMKKNAANPVIGAGTRLTAYNMWDATTGTLVWDAIVGFGGDNLHTPAERSGYCGLEVMSDGRGMPYNHYDLDGLQPYNYYPVIWPDQGPGQGVWGYKDGIPESERTEDFAQGEGDWTWPYATFQLYDNGTVEDTIIHIFASEAGAPSNAVLRYFRRYGAGPHPESPGLAWSHMTVDSGQTISTVVEAAPPNVTAGFEGKVALVWNAYFGATSADDGESGFVEPISLLLEQNAQSAYCMVSMDAGATWGSKYNISKNSITDENGWWPYADISAVIDTDGRLHVVYAARPFQNLTGVAGGPADPQMNYPLFPMGSRILHWSDDAETIGTDNLDDNYITIVRDGMADWTEMDSICVGGAWHSMALNLPSIGQCDDKLYVTFAQFQDVANGIWDNCHVSAWTQNITAGSANANLYFTVSPMSNGGLNWDPARLLTDFTRRCDTAETGNPGVPVDPTATNVCHSHFYNSMTRWGMNSDGGDFANAVRVSDPAWTHTSTDYYMDVFYVDDLWPGGLVQGEGMWAIDPIKWFRFPCVDAEQAPILSYEPTGIFENTPSWSKPGVEREIDVTMSNIGNAALTVSSIVVEEIDNADPSYDGWLAVDERGFSGTITEVVPSNSFDIGLIINNNSIINETAVLKGRVIFNSTAGNGADTLRIGYIVADTVQPYFQDTLFTQSIGITVANNGNYGGGLFDTCGRMDFHILGNLGIECDTCGVGFGNVEWKYLSEGAPFVVRDIGGGEVRLSTSVSAHSAYSEVPDSDDIRDGFRPQTGQADEHTNAAFCTWIESGEFVTADSAVAMKNYMIAPMTSADTSDFFVLVTKFYNNTDAALSGVYLGTIEDWDIPTDSGTRNTSDFDADRKLMYLQGWEAEQADTFCANSLAGNDCNESDLRLGGSAFFGGFQFKTSGVKPENRFEEAQGSFSFKRSNWLGLEVRSHVPAQRMYDTLSGIFFGYSPWHSTLPDPVTDQDSLYRDLSMITSYGSYDLGVTDTLVFVKFLASEYQGGLAGLQETVDQAKAFTLNYLCCDIWGLPGDADVNGAISILDVVYIINFKYKQGPGVKWPSSTYDAGTDYDNCDNIMDCNAKAGIDILDVVYLINYKYKQGPDPICPTPWLE